MTMMPPDVPASVPQALPFHVKIVRWFQSGVIWVFIAGLVMNVGPLLLSSLGGLHLTGDQQVWYSILINVVLYAAGAYIHNQSTAVIGSKSDVAAAQSTGSQ